MENDPLLLWNFTYLLSIPAVLQTLALGNPPYGLSVPPPYSLLAPPNGLSACLLLLQQDRKLWLLAHYQNMMKIFMNGKKNFAQNCLKTVLDHNLRHLSFSAAHLIAFIYEAGQNVSIAIAFRTILHQQHH